MEDTTIGPGVIATCSRGIRGLILSEKPKLVKYRDGNEAVAWTGICLDHDCFAEPWSSRNPTFVDRIPEEIAIYIRTLRAICSLV